MSTWPEPNRISREVLTSEVNSTEVNSTEVNNPEVLTPKIDSPEVISREPWPASGIEFYNCIEDGPWGYLLVYSDGRFRFDDSAVPSRAEILARWSIYLERD